MAGYLLEGYDQRGGEEEDGLYNEFCLVRRIGMREGWVCVGFGPFGS